MVDRRDATEEELVDRYLLGLGRREDHPGEEEVADRSFLSYLSGPDSYDVMNQARFLFDEFNESVIPETPSPCRASGVAGCPPTRGAGCPPSRGEGCRSKRRRLVEEVDASPWPWQMTLSNHPNLHPSPCMRPSCSSSSSSSSSSTSSSSCSLPMTEQPLLQGGVVSEFESRCTRALSRAGLGPPTADCTLGGPLDSGSLSEALPDGWGWQAGPLEGLQGPESAARPAPPQCRKRGRTRPPRVAPPTPREAPSAPPTPGEASLSFLTAEERRWMNGEQLGEAAGPLVDLCGSAEEEAVVRTLQLEEDEATARSLQDQFDREDVRPHTVQGNPYMEPRWTPASSSLQGIMAAFQDELIGRPRGRGRSRTAGRRYRTRPDLSADLEGNNYEALLQFEEQQGAVVNRMLMSRQQIDRFPTKTFSLALNAVAAQCHICFGDYADGEQLRILSCFHDYHVACIDRWLKDNATCPICRANMTES